MGMPIEEMGTRALWGLPDEVRRAEVQRRLKERNRRQQRLRAAAIAATVQRCTAEQWQQMLTFFGHRCVCCGVREGERYRPALSPRLQPAYLERDHVVPLTKGGDDSVTNSQPLCPTCNAPKKGRSIDYRADFWERFPPMGQEGACV